MTTTPQSSADGASKKTEHPSSNQATPEQPSQETEVKNAHASGDGSFGRNDESLPEESTEAEEPETPAY